MADHLAVLNMPMEALKRSATVTSFDPLTLLPVLSQHTKHLGLIATASTTFAGSKKIPRYARQMSRCSRACPKANRLARSLLPGAAERPYRSCDLRADFIEARRSTP